MNKISKISEITYQDIADYLRLTELSEDDINTLKNLIDISKQFISKYTGHTIEELDDYQDFVIVVFILCQDMWDNRSLYIDNKNLNKVVETVLNMHAVNLL